MTDASPHIFRSLEKTIGPEGFDTIVRAAVASYAALQRPSETQARDFGRLVIPLFDRTDAETRRVLAASLSATPRLPRPLVERILAEPIEIVAPFLLSSPLLKSDDIAHLTARRDPSLKKILVARRLANRTVAEPRRRPKALETPPGVPQAHESAAAEVSRLTPSRQTALLSMGTNTEFVGGNGSAEISSDALPASVTPPDQAEETRRILRQMVLPGRKPAPHERQYDRLDLLSLAIAKDREGFYAALAGKLLLDSSAMASIESDEVSEPLAVALRATDVTTADAMTILMMMKPRIGADVVAFEAMERLYAALDAADCAARFGIATHPAAARARLEPQYADLPPLPRGEVRQIFGRRKTAPTRLPVRREGK